MGPGVGVAVGVGVGLVGSAEGGAVPLSLSAAGESACDVVDVVADGVAAGWSEAGWSEAGWSEG